MLERKYKLLGEVVRSYIREAEPVGSKTLETKLGVSSATIRNDMASLEEEGFLRQPHTSAGRVPTINGFQFYLDNLRQVKEPKQAEQKTLRAVLERQVETENRAKELARALADISQGAALLAFTPDHTYYTGLANLFQQPEFADLSMVREMGEVVDHLDDGLRTLLPLASQRVEVCLGDKNPLGQDCALVYSRLTFFKQPLFIGLLGPVRMDYDANIGRLNYVTQLIAN